jgi:cyclopropane fatty-acyl-phospholipid synthase-like methyltransferase
MGDRAKFQQHYDRFKATGRLPWQHAEPNRFLGAVHQARGQAGTALDLGCGSGVDSVYLARLGWDVTSIDFMPEALDLTRRLAAEANVALTLVLADVTEWEEGRQFDLVLDSGLMHNLNRDQLPTYRARLLQWLKPGGDFVLAHWESRSDADRLRGGARRASRQQILDYFAPDLREHRFSRLEATGVPEPIGPDLSVGFYWFR